MNPQTRLFFASIFIMILGGIGLADSDQWWEYVVAYVVIAVGAWKFNDSVRPGPGEK